MTLGKLPILCAFLLLLCAWPAHATIFWDENFEDEDWSVQSGVNGSTGWYVQGFNPDIGQEEIRPVPGRIDIVTGGCHSGNKCVRLTYTDLDVGAGPFAYRYYNTRHVFTRAWIKIPTDFQIAGNATKFVYGPIGEGNIGCLTFSVVSNGRPIFSCQTNASQYPGSGGYYLGNQSFNPNEFGAAPITPPIKDGQWHCLESEAWMYQAGPGNGEMRFWIDGVMPPNGELVNVPFSNNSNPFNILKIYQERGIGVLYHDDIAVADQRIGCGSIIPVDTTPPSTVTGVTVTGTTSSSIGLSWTAATDDSGFINGYSIESCQGSGCTSFAQAAFVSTTSTTITGLSANTTYRFRLKAQDPSGNSSVNYSTIVSGTTQAASTQIIGIDSSGKFTINGTPTYLVGMSYFNVLNWHSSDIDTFAANGWNLIRVIVDNQSFQPVGTDTIFNADGSLNASRKAIVDAFIQYCKDRGIIVEIVVMHADADPLTSATWMTTAAARRAAVTNAVTAFNPYGNVIFDLVNEHIFGTWADTESEMTQYITAARSASGTAIIGYSSSEASGGHIFTAGTNNIVGSQINAELANNPSMFLPHTERDASWYSSTGARATNIRSHFASVGKSNIALYFNEENRNTKAPYGGGGGPFTASNFIQSARECKENGCAGWIFHTAAGFDLSSSTFMSQLDAAEATVISTLPSSLSTSTPATERQQLYSDDFNRANAGTLGASWTAGYTAHDSLTVSSNAAKATAIDPAESMSSYGTVPPNDQWAQATLGTWTGSSYSEGRIRLRAAAPPTRTAYECRFFRNNGTVRSRIVMKPDSGPQTVLAEDNSTTWAAGDIARCEVQGTTIRFYRTTAAGVESLLLSASDGTYSSGRVGLYLYNVGSINDTTLDDFKAGDFTTVLPTITAVTVDAAGANVTWTGSPASIRVQTNLQNVVEPISSFNATTGRYTKTWPAGTTFVCFYARTASGTENTTDFKCANITVTNPDTQPPTIGTCTPSGTLVAGTTSTTLTCQTDEIATCKWSSVDQSYAAMPNSMTTANGLTHAATHSGLTNGTSYTDYVRCQDAVSPPNANTSSRPVAFNVAPAPAVDTTAPSTVTGLACLNVVQTSISCTWNAATDNVAVSHYLISYCAGAGCTSYQVAGNPSVLSFILNNLSPNTVHNIVVDAVDTSGNLSAAHSNVFTATTLPVGDSTPPSDMLNLRTVGAVQYNAVSLGWDPGSDNVQVAGATIERCEGAGCTNFAVLATTSENILLDNSVQSERVYRYRGRFFDPSMNFSQNYSTILDVTIPVLSEDLVIGLCPCNKLVH